MLSTSIPMTLKIGMQCGSQTKSSAHSFCYSLCISSPMNLGRCTIQVSITSLRRGIIATFCPHHWLLQLFPLNWELNSVSYLLSGNILLRYYIDTKPEDNFISTPVLVSFHALASFLMWIKLLYFMRIYKETGNYNNFPYISSFRLLGEDHFRVHIWNAHFPLHLFDLPGCIQWGFQPHWWCN